MSHYTTLAYSDSLSLWASAVCRCPRQIQTLFGPSRKSWSHQIFDIFSEYQGVGRSGGWLGRKVDGGSGRDDELAWVLLDQIKPHRCNLTSFDIMMWRQLSTPTYLNLIINFLEVKLPYEPSCPSVGCAVGRCVS